MMWVRNPTGLRVNSTTNTEMIQKIDFAGVEPLAHGCFAVDLLQQVNVTLSSVVHEAVLEMMGRFRSAAIAELLNTGESPWQGEEPWEIWYCLDESGLALRAAPMEGGMILGWWEALPRVLAEYWKELHILVQAGEKPEIVYDGGMRRWARRPCTVRLEDVLCAAGERVFRQRLRDAVMDSLLDVQHLTETQMDEQRWEVLQRVLCELDAAAELYDAGGQVFGACLWCKSEENGRVVTTDMWDEAEEMELYCMEPEGGGLGRDRLGDLYRILRACGVLGDRGKREKGMPRAGLIIPLQ